MSVAGGCRCGAVRYTLDVERLPNTYACHCLDCQTWSGSAFSQHAVVPESALNVSGPIAVYELKTEDRISVQRVCATCHCRVFNTNTARPGLAVIRAGTLDESDKLDVVAHIWVKRKQAWITIPEGVPQWEEGAPPADFAAALFAERRQ
jgi:hypothetical protein